MTLLVDMNLSPRWVGVLAANGLRAVHWSNVGAADAPDVQIMAYAREHGQVVLTHNLDFSAILAATQGKKPSVVQVRADNVNPDVIGKEVVAAILQMKAELEEGALLNIDPKRARIRLLPLRQEF